MVNIDLEISHGEQTYWRVLRYQSFLIGEIDVSWILLFGIDPSVSDCYTLEDEFREFGGLDECVG